MINFENRSNTQQISKFKSFFGLVDCPDCTGKMEKISKNVWVCPRCQWNTFRCDNFTYKSVFKTLLS